jgi:tetrapyrrole methylase family protein/MazG family protein
VATIEEKQNGMIKMDADYCLTAPPDRALLALNQPEAHTRDIGAFVSPFVSVVAPVNKDCCGCYLIWKAPDDLGIDISNARGIGAEIKLGVDEPKSSGAGVPGSLVVAGLGIRAAGQLTDEVKAAIATADRVIYMNDPESTLDVERFNAVIRAVNPDIADVGAFDDGSASANSERAITARIEEIIKFVVLGQKVCIVTYGHPAVYNAIIHRVVRRAREAKLAATVLPAISSVDCLCADMLVDQFAHSLQVSGALAFVALKREVDPSVSLALLQPSFLTAADRTALVKRLMAAFPGDHVSYLYSASTSSRDLTPVIEPIEIARLAGQAIKPGFILFIPGISEPEIDKGLMKQFERRRPVR